MYSNASQSTLDLTIYIYIKCNNSPYNYYLIVTNLKLWPFLSYARRLTVNITDHLWSKLCIWLISYLLHGHLVWYTVFVPYLQLKSYYLPIVIRICIYSNLQHEYKLLCQSWLCFNYRKANVLLILNRYSSFAIVHMTYLLKKISLKLGGKTGKKLF